MGGGRMTEYELTVHPFEMGAEKDAALKPLEEAAEVFGAWQMVDGCGSPNQCCVCEVHDNCDAPIELACEIADCITACCNLAARYDIDLQDTLRRVEAKNRRRGRYDA